MTDEKPAKHDQLNTVPPQRREFSGKVIDAGLISDLNTLVTQRFRKTAVVLVLNIVVTISLITCFELIARLFDNGNDYEFFSDRTDMVRGRPFVATDNKVGFLLVPNYMSHDINVNSNGFRGSELEDDINKNYVILAIGGSTTFGWGLDDRHTYPQQLENALRANALVRKSGVTISVINGGIPSFTSTQQNCTSVTRSTKSNRI